MEDEDVDTPPQQPPQQPPSLDKDTTLLSKVATNHLFLTQFEAFRATIITLRHRNPNLALSILQTIVSHGGNFKNIVFSSNCSSPALLTWLSSLELFKFGDDATSVWSDLVSIESVRLRVEFLLYVQIVSFKVSERLARVLEVEDEVEDGVRGSVRVLDEIMEVGLRRLKEDLIVNSSEERESGSGGSGGGVAEEELRCLRRVVLGNADVFASLCENIQGQVGVELEKEDENELAITVRREARVGMVSSEEDQRVLKSIQKYVQVAHLDEMRECVDKEDVDGAVSQIRYLHLDYGVAEEEYRYVSVGSS